MAGYAMIEQLIKAIKIIEMATGKKPKRIELGNSKHSIKLIDVEICGSASTIGRIYLKLEMKTQNKREKNVI